MTSWKFSGGDSSHVTVVYFVSSLTIAFYFWWWYLGFKKKNICEDYLDEHLSIINLSFSQNLLFAIIKNPTEKYDWLFVEGTDI